ncbi:trypsin [Ancylostoma ceylanicum]|uniref:Trypsin n=1 Tax=Ancylostoma ceylanicum TaxID=53326 RepID=A0A0D6M1I3_9BILA|nr:trypsin [Ancylostoma ceylanicum]
MAAKTDIISVCWLETTPNDEPSLPSRSAEQLQIFWWEKRSTERISMLWAHEQWDECDLSHDIALIELKNNVPILESSPVCLPEENTKIAQLLHSAGSGMDSTITSGNKYARGMQVVNLRRKSENKTLAMITTRGQSSAMCGGDSGGPLFQFNTRGQYTAVGVVSGALVECGEENFRVCPISVRTNAPSIVNTAPVVQSYSQNARPSNTFFTWNQGSNSANNFNQQSNWFYLNDQTKRVMYLNQQSNGIYSNMWSNPNYFNQRSYPGYNHLY